MTYMLVFIITSAFTGGEDRLVTLKEYKTEIECNAVVSEYYSEHTRKTNRFLTCMQNRKLEA